jgi:N-acetylglucosamine kinase-like BadF-type ATPase
MKKAGRKILNKIAALGVDRGGTWTRVAAFDSRLRRLREARFRTAPLRSLPPKLKAIVHGWAAAGAPLVIASRGVFSKKWKKPFLLKALAGELNLCDVVSDAEAAHYAAFRGGSGLLLIAGTGAVVFRGKPGAFSKAGGFNPAAGDPGSGRWLGRLYLRKLGRKPDDSKAAHGRTAAHAGRLLARAGHGDPGCALLAAAAWHELAELLRSAAAGSRGGVKVSLAGGLMDNDYFRSGFLKTARQALPGRRLSVIQAGMSAEEAAARLALKRKP